MSDDLDEAGALAVRVLAAVPAPGWVLDILAEDHALEVLLEACKPEP